MGLLSNILKVGGAIGSAVAAPFTGGTSLAWLPAAFGGASALGSAMSGAASGMAGGREREAQLLNQQDQNKLSSYGTQQRSILDALGLKEKGALDRAGLDLSQRQFGLSASQQRAKQMLIGQLLSSWKPFTINDPRAQRFQMGGGLGDLGPQARQMGDLLMQQALAGQQPGSGAGSNAWTGAADTFAPTPQTDFMSGLIAPPSLSQIPKAGLLEKILGAGGMAGSLLGAFTPKSTGLPGRPMSGLG